MKNTLRHLLIAIFAFTVQQCNPGPEETPPNTIDPCDKAYNSDLDFVPYTLGQELKFKDLSGTNHVTLKVEQFSNTAFPYHEMGDFCTRKIVAQIGTPWTNANGEPLKIKIQLVGYSAAKERIISVVPDDFQAEVFFYTPGFGPANNGRVFEESSYTFGPETFQNVLLARCGASGDLGYAPDKCNCPITQKLIFERKIGLVALENSAGQWILE